VTLKLRYSDFETHTKQQSFKKAIVTGEEIAEVARSLFASFPMKKKIRLIGVSAGDLQGHEADPQQLQLFGEASSKEKLSHIVDELKEKFGTDAVRRASQLL
jgi:DNA polymerase-4